MPFQNTNIRQQAMSFNPKNDLQGQPIRFEFFTPQSSQQAVEMAKENRGSQIDHHELPIAANDEDKLTKTIKFTGNNANEIIDLPWPDVIIADNIEPSSKISELGRIFIHYLNDIGVIKADLKSPSFDEKTTYVGIEYMCSLKFLIKNDFQRFKVLLNLTYGVSNKKVFADNIISSEELIDYLKDLIIFRKQVQKQDAKYRNLKLLNISCSINDLELEI